jgi:EAL domain-containing protein (putative c-di-GMP-specific phosphodiesterase class I)/ActR/RegA family two-component response regulator
MTIATLLVVDDSIVQRRHVAELAQRVGIARVVEAADGAEALRALQAASPRPDLMVIDLEMPTMDGVELIQQLRLHHPDVPFVVASGRENALVGAVEQMARALGLPVVGGVRKPLTVDALKAAADACGRLHAPAGTDAAPPELTPHDLDLALASGAVVPHYQPKVDVRSGLVRGVEVLARWPHPVYGHVPPDRFVHLAEQSGRIRALTTSVLSQALAQAARWIARGLPLSVAVNLSPRLLDAPQLVDEICSLVESHRLATSQVVLEVTESSVADSLGVALGVLARLRMKGFKLSIDDYGTGFSSMQQLARASFTELKIDRSFVHGAHRQANLQVILQSALEMGQRLNLATVAEGVETIDDWRLLQRFGCDVGQGWLIAKAMPAAELPGWLKRHGARLAELRAAAPAGVAR